jgi:hypothetical protein
MERQWRIVASVVAVVCETRHVLYPFYLSKQIESEKKSGQSAAQALVSSTVLLRV